MRLSEEKSHRDENVKNDEKKLHKDEKKQKKKKIEMKKDDNHENKVQKKLSSWLKTISPKKDEKIDEKKYEKDEK